MFTHEYMFSGKNNGPSALFSDGEYIGQIAAAKDVRLALMIKHWTDFITSIHMIDI